MNEEAPQDSKQQVSTALDFKQKREASEKGEVIRLLGSGLSVRVKRPQIKRLVAMGIIPDSLASFLIKAEREDIKPKDLPTLFELQKIIAENMIMEPKIAEKPDYDKGEIAIDDLDDADVNTLWTWFQGGREAVESFRVQRERVSAGLDKPKIPEPATK